MLRLRPLVALLSACLVPACGSSPSQPADETDPPLPPTPSPVVASIDGPTIIERVVGDESPTTANFSAASSTGPIIRYQWFESNASQPFAEGPSVERIFSDFGEFWTRLRVEGSEGQSDETDHRTVVEPDLANSTGPVLSAFRYWGGPTYSLLYLDPEAGLLDVVIEDMVSLTEPADQDGCSWSPSWNSLVVAARDIWKLSRDGQELTKIVDTNGLARHPDWSPDGQWIAYNDNGEGDAGFGSPLYVIRPSGSGRQVVGGDPTDWRFHVGRISWDPTSTRIAGSSQWEVAPGEERDRIVIFSDLWATPSRSVLHTEEQITDAYGTAFLVGEGLNGIDWSPDGEWLVYAVIVTTIESGQYNNVHMIVKAKADGSGDPQILVSRDEADYVVKPIWSPDGSLVYYAQRVQSAWHIFKISASGGEPHDVTASIRPGDYHSIGCM